MRDLTNYIIIHHFENQPNNLSPMFPTFPGTLHRVTVTNVKQIFRAITIISTEYHFKISFQNVVIVQRHPNHKSSNRKALAPIQVKLLKPNPLHHQHQINIAREHNPVLLYVEILYFLVKIFELKPRQYQENYASIYKFFGESFHAFLYNKRSFCRLARFWTIVNGTLTHRRLTTIDLRTGPNSEQGVGQWQPA